MCDASGDLNQSFETTDPASTSQELTADKPELPPYPGLGSGDGYQSGQHSEFQQRQLFRNISPHNSLEYSGSDTARTDTMDTATSTTAAAAGLGGK